jgi:hypothetical protein
MRLSLSDLIGMVVNAPKQSALEKGRFALQGYFNLERNKTFCFLSALLGAFWLSSATAIYLRLYLS